MVEETGVVEQIAPAGKCIERLVTSRASGGTGSSPLYRDPQADFSSLISSERMVARPPWA